jgi:hypothetical protein
VSRFAALAVAHPAANAVGQVAFTLGVQGIVLELAGVRPHVRGFALGGEAQHATLVVPYSALRGLVRSGPYLVVSFDPRVLFPFNRFVLARVQRELDASLPRVRRLASWSRVFGVVLAAGLGVGAWLAGGRAGLGRTVSWIVAFGVAWLAWSAVSKIRARWLHGGALAERLSRELEARLAERLGITPGDVEVLDARGDELAVAALAAVSRPRWLVPAVVVGLVGLVGATVLVKRFGVVERVRLPVPEARTGLLTDLPRLLEHARADVAPRRGACRCVRADSPLWPSPPPGVAILVTPLRGDLDAVSLRPESVYPVAHRGKDVIELEVQIVNGTTMTLPEVALVFTFWRREGNERKNIIERGLSWPRALEPGGAVRWRVRSRGDALKVTSYLPAASERAPFAPADTFARLFENKTPASVRLHAVTMLAYLGDERALEATRGLGVLSPLEERQRALLLETFPPFVACDVTAAGACVMNRSDALVRRVSLRDGKERRVMVDDLFFPGRGLRVDATGMSAPLRVEPDYEARR